MVRNGNEILSGDDIEHIHRTSMKLLANVGVEFPDDEAVAVFKKHGFRIDGQKVYASEDQVMSALENEYSDINDQAQYSIPPRRACIASTSDRAAKRRA